MTIENPVVAIMYDFDGTLIPGDLEEYNFLPELGISQQEFSAEFQEMAEQNEMDYIQAFMYIAINRAKEKELPITRRQFMEYGKEIRFYLFGSSFYYGPNVDAVWPAVALNYTAKTQILFRISKGCLNIADNEGINNVVEACKRHVRFENMIYIGDGKTDIPCMKLIRSRGGHSIAVYGPECSSKVAVQLKSEGRADFAVPANYSEGKELDTCVKGIIEKLAVQVLNV